MSVAPITVPRKPLRLLYLNYHLDTRKIFARVFRQWMGVEIETAGTCAEGWAWWEKASEPFDVAMGRWGMPDGDGLRTLSEMKQRYGCATVATLSCELGYYGSSYDPATIDYRIWVPSSTDQLHELMIVLAKELGRAVPPSLGPPFQKVRRPVTEPAGGV